MAITNNNNFRTLMIHEVTDHVKNYKFFESDLLTFDDGLYSQYLYHNELNNNKNKKIFFISSNIIRSRNINPSSEVITCSLAHDIFFKTNNNKYYMSLKEILELNNNNNIIIGGHGHYHLNLRFYNNLNLKDYFKIIKEDCDNLINFFEKNNLKLTHFCWPYNHEDRLYKALLLRYNKDIIFFGQERIDIG
jgi:hypothetical protein